MYYIYAMLIENFFKFLKYYGRGKKKQIVKYICLAFITACFEFFGIALVYPFMLLLLSPQSIKLPVSISPYFLGVLVVILFLIKNIFMIWQLKEQNKFVISWGNDIKNRFIQYFLFSSHKSINSIPISEKLYIINSLVPLSLSEFVLRVLNLIINFWIVLIILLLLYMKFTVAALAATIFTFVSMLFQNIYFKNRTSSISQKLVVLNREFQKKLQEICMNLKQIKIGCLESKFFSEYKENQEDLTKLSVLSSIYAGIPPYVTEVLVILSIVVLFGIVSISENKNTDVLIASYALMAAAIFRIAPALNRIQSSINGINVSSEYIKSLVIKYEELKLENVFLDASVSTATFNNSIGLKNIVFSYSDNKVIIDNLSMEIKKGEFIGIIGASGVGKSTLADILMGLLPLDSGEILVDDKLIKNTSLRKLIGYVPQKTVLLGNTVADCITWGCDIVDEARIIDVLKKVRLYDFIVENYENGIYSEILVDSEGLSVGQMQRLSIARALYSNPQILILDEATSALDLETEHEVCKILNDLKGRTTIIAIAHRLSTLKSCDRLFYMKEGRIDDYGTFSELLEKNKDFENLIRISNFDDVLN